MNGDKTSILMVNTILIIVTVMICSFYVIHMAITIINIIEITPVISRHPAGAEGVGRTRRAERRRGRETVRLAGPKGGQCLLRACFCCYDRDRLSCSW